MLPESNFPISGGIMQTEEVVPRATSAGIDTGTPTEEISHQQTQLQHQLHHQLPQLQHLPSPLESLITHMAVKQEPQEEEDREQVRTSPSPQAETHVVQSGLPNGGQGQVQIQAQAMMGRTEGLQPAQDTSGRARPSRGRRKSRWKLKFHHQALPPEYLDHYEAALAQEALNSPPTPVQETMAPSPAPTTSTSTPSPIADVHGWLQRIAAMQQELCPPVTTQNSVPPSPQTPNYRRSVITSTPNAHPHPPHHHHHSHSHSQSHHHPLQQAQPAPRPPMKYSDLPYMGEITLDNSKPRRGRKPKKADICHLIYKNYGTILPGTPGLEERKQLNSPRIKIENKEQPAQVSFQRTDIQNRISSLLEKRLTQESRRNHSVSDNQKISEQEEPLNLCIRDLNQLKIRLLRKHGNVYESGQVKSEGSSDGEEVECLGATTPVEGGENLRSIDVSNNNNNNININNNNNNLNESVIGPNPGFVYWPNGGVFIHPMALQSQFLYYQKMAQNGNNPGLPPGSDHPTVKEQKIVPNSIYSMLAERKSPAPTPPTPVHTASTPAPPPPTPPTVQQTVATTPAESPRPKRSGPGGSHGQPTKRKRSAIFIPPMPTENNNNPATEVSICKFKFTGGAKPSLQEKKSLSVDSGGNFRYYSGTGDKSMRGYEFFPREALQQPAGQAGSSAGAFLNAAGERIPPPSQRPGVATPEDGRRKRKTRKSLQREKLEQTFKEKGFLIQTQQLESAEGATYCKFRQLRKFTRYLFRSWKDYLPGNVRELTGAEGEQEVEGEGDRESPIIGAHGVPGGIVELPPAILDEPQSLPQSLPLT
ncbi:serine/arginine repetitive matrix protein 1 [Athalia rosae]|uniref:serine/arginine repetitive matrix protein 1 n=1 Tax=Athalia rosae TaxID=37344 RepID=UPI002033D511|nr:serine/arginine repetitive matrix protein 1 [Athalia rosae]